MSEEPNVQVVADDGIKEQFGQGDFYRRSAWTPKKIRNASITVFLLALLPMILVGSPDDGKEKKTDLGFSGDVRSSQEVDLPSHAEVRAGINADAEKAKSQSRSRIRYGAPQLFVRPKANQIPPGTLVKAILVSGGANGTVKAELQESIFANGDTVLPERTVLIGQGSSTEERLLVQFNKAVRNGFTIPVHGEALDFGDRIAGLKGSKVSHYTMNLAAGVGLNFVGGMSDALQDRDGVNGAVVRRASLKNSLLNGAATASLEQSKDFMTRAKEKQSVIEVPSGTELFILFDSEK